MIVCVCHRVNDKTLEQEIEQAVNLDELKDKLLVGTNCGACLETIQHMLENKEITNDSTATDCKD